MFSRKPRIETPFLKGYIRRSKSYPSYVPAWLGPGAWGLFALLFAISIPIDFGGLGIVLAGLIAWAASAMVSGSYKPVTEEDRFDETAYSAIRKLKFLFAQGIGGSVPPRILLALEKAVESYNTAATSLASEDPIKSGPAKRELEHLLHACFVAAMPIIKDENHSRKEWQKMRESNAFIGQIVDAIDQQSSHMLDHRFARRDRFAALGELGYVEADSAGTVHQTG